MFEFSDTQKKVVAAGITVLACTMVITFAAAIMYGVVKLLSLASSALVPVLLGFFLALFFKPYYQWWRSVVRNPSLALISMMLTVAVPLCIFFWYAGAVVVDQISNLIEQGPRLVGQVSAWLNGTFPKAAALLQQSGFGLGNLSSIYENYSATAMKAGSSVLECVFGIVSLVVTMIFFAYFIMSKELHGKDIVSHLAFLKNDTRSFVAEQIDAFTSILVSFFQRQAVICLIEGVMYGTGFALVGLPYGFLLGFLLGVLNLIPLFGSVVCLPIALPLAYFNADGSVVRLWAVIAVWATGQFLDGYLITPKIQGNRTGLGYAGVIFSFFFWSTLLGPMLGMLLAIPLSAFCVVLWRAVKFRYIRPVV